jgi:hypothetical protein
MDTKQVTVVIFTQREIRNIFRESCHLNGGNDNARIQITIEDGVPRVSHPDNDHIEHVIEPEEPVNDKNGH